MKASARHPTAATTSFSTFVLALMMGCGLASTAWAGDMPDCPVEPFADVSAAQRATMLAGGCKQDSSRWKLDTPRAQPIDAGPSQVKAKFSTLSSQQFASLLGTLKFDWSGMRESDARGGARSMRTALAAGGLLKVDDSLSLQMNLGVEHAVAAPRTRATMSSLWQPTKAGLLFAEWAGSDAGTESRRVGGRWWLVPRKLALDLAARQLPDGLGWVDQRIGLAFDLKL